MQTTKTSAIFWYQSNGRMDMLNVSTGLFVIIYIFDQNYSILYTTKITYLLSHFGFVCVLHHDCVLRGVLYARCQLKSLWYSIRHKTEREKKIQLDGQNEYTEGF